MHRSPLSRAGANLLCAALLSILAAGPAEAQLGRKSWEFFPHLGGYVPGDPDFLKDEPGFEGYDPGVLWGICMTYHYTDYVGVELGFSKATANHADVPSLGGPAGEASLGDLSTDFWELNGFLNSGALKRLQLFATAGGGLVNFDPENGNGVTRLLVDGGVGIRYYAWKNIALRGEVKDFYFPKATRADVTGCVDSIEGRVCPGPGPDDDVHNIGIFGGLTFNF